jgi:hypothetical protein
MANGHIFICQKEDFKLWVEIVEKSDEFFDFHCKAP